MLLLYWLLDVGYILFGRFSFVERSLSSRACCLLWPITRKFMKREKDSIKIHPCAGIIFVADESLFLRRKRNPKRRSLFSGMHLLMDEQLLLHSSSNDTIERKTTLPSIFWVHVLGSSSNSLLVSLPLVFTTHRSQSGIAKNHLPHSSTMASSEPPPPNPMLTAYEGWAAKTPLVTRYILSLQAISYMA